MIIKISACVTSIILSISSPVGPEVVLNPGFPVSYCQNDPGDHPDLQTHLQYTWGRAPVCHPPLAYSLTCLNEKVLEYQKNVYDFNKQYRLMVCDCWANHPTDVVARNECIAYAKSIFDVGIEASKVYFDLSLFECCTGNP